MLVVQGQDPKQSIYYLSACCYSLLSKYGSVQPVSLYEYVKKQFCTELNYNRFILCIDFLYLNSKIDLDEHGFLTLKD